MNARFLVYALFCTHMIYGMEQNAGNTKQQELQRELAEMTAFVRNGGESLAEKDVQALIEQLRALRTTKESKKRDKSRSPIMRSRGLGMSSSIAVFRMRG